MNLRITILYILFFFSLRFDSCNQLKANNSIKQEQESLRCFVGDFDFDGNRDSVSIFESYGSSSYSIKVSIYDSRQIYIYEQEFNSGCFFNPIYINKYMYQRFNKLFNDSVFRYPVKKADDSFDWLKSAFCSKTYIDSSYFDLFIKYKPVWVSMITWPESYKYITKSINAETCPRLDSSVIIVYTADNHNDKKSLTETNSAVLNNNPLKGDEISIINSKHAVLIKKKSLYSWVFINDENITDGSEKLRSASISKTLRWKNLAIIVQNQSEGKRVFIIDYQLGLCLRLKTKSYSDESLTGIKLKGYKIIFETAKGLKIIDMKVLSKLIKNYTDF
jgi:hypothetical protein